MTYAVVFPGQGSQAIGMLTSLYAEINVVKDTFTAASDVIGYDVWELISQGPKERLDSTEYTQVAMLTSGIAIWRAWFTYTNKLPVILSGHSLGEYTALVVASAISLKEAVMLVQKRGQLMQQAAPVGVGGMIAILGLSDANVLKACELASCGEELAPANYNSPGQVVVAGRKTAIERLSVVAKELGAKRAIILPMSVPSHSIMLKDAALQFKEYLKGCEWLKPTINVVHNFNVAISTSKEEIILALYQQLFSPVRWVEIINHIATKTNTILEFGPGAILTGLNKRINKYLVCVTVEDIKTISSEVEKLHD